MAFVFKPFMGMSLYEDVIPRMGEYFNRKGLSTDKQLGYGKDGLVYSTTAMTVVKGLKFADLYGREKSVYERFSERGILHVAGFAIPKLVGFDDELWVVEMRQVSPPYIVDFAGAGLDKPVAVFDEEIAREAFENQKENFGDDWPWVQSAVSELRAIGVYLSDLNTNNIRCHPDDAPPAHPGG